MLLCVLLFLGPKFHCLSRSGLVQDQLELQRCGLQRRRVQKQSGEAWASVVWARNLRVLGMHPRCSLEYFGALSCL